ncbi:hypothetical protein, partial [Enterococcus faecium]|uniref:hypothetical protein n=1 Tax=Enterococcus faecium TaxID=1352 RepID=UPI003F443C46
EGTAWSHDLSRAYEEWTAEHGGIPLSRRIGFVPVPDEVAAAMSEVLGEADAVVVAPSGSAAPALAAAARAGRTVGEGR